MFWGHILHKLQGGSLPTLSNPINKSNIIQADLYHKIARCQMIGSSDCLVVAGDLWEADYICSYASLQVMCCSNSTVIGYSKLENVSVIININMFILLYIRQLQLWNFLRTYIGQIAKGCSANAKQSDHQIKYYLSRSKFKDKKILKDRLIRLLSNERVF